jgi:hypothetical protein
VRSAAAPISEEKPKPVVKKLVMRPSRRKTEGDHPDASAEAMKTKTVMRRSRRREG